MSQARKKTKIKTEIRSEKTRKFLKLALKRPCFVPHSPVL